MPQPKSFTSYNAFAIPDETLNTAIGKYNYYRRYHRITGNPVPIFNREGVNTSIGFGYATDRLNANTSLVQNKNQAVWTQLYSTGSIGDNYYWRGVYAVGSYSENIKLKNLNTYKHTVLAQFGRKWSPNFATSIGVLILSNFDDPKFIPTAHISYSTGKWVIDAALPNNVNIRYIQNKKLHFLVTNTLSRRSYYNINDQLSYKYTINEVGFQAEVKILGVLWGELSVAKPYGLKMELQNKSIYNEIGEVSQLLGINVGLFIRFQQVYEE
ncbi:MAG: DUF6268 family outer membrane beta-barrel protein [Cyclobacteriaceae bacterium]|nr:DUF6268 family outer membrane beta-barrel protein [Cyclobacteriaceae bacterium]